MTKLLLACLLCFACATLGSAQPYKGQKFIAGSLSLFSQNDDNGDFSDDTRSFSIRISPRFGFMVSDRTALSLGVSFEYSESTQLFNTSRNNLITNNGIGIDLSSRHFFPLGLGLGMYLQPNFSYRSLHGENIVVGNFGQIEFGPFERETLAIGLSPGVYYFLSDRVAVEASLGNLQFSHSIMDRNPDFGQTDSRKSNTFSFVGGTQLALGISYFWGGPNE